MPEFEQTRMENIDLIHSQTVKSKKMALFNTSSTELRHLFIAWIAISYAFAIVMAWIKLDPIKPTTSQIFGPYILELMVISLVTVGVSFIAHEMGHKFVAQKYGAWAEFRMSVNMLLLAILMAWQIGILFAAPGAVQIFGPHLSKSQYGKVAASGPLMNLFLAFVFLPLLTDKGIMLEIGRWGVLINMLLAGFNMLPISVLDGRKVLAWSVPVYIGLFILIITVGIFMIYFLPP
jgi:Zn-dependent protease